ncbi:MAG: dCTP deaminase [Candidatus Pacearchaeota archaeon]|nr:dCTP deaminase [Candidatus Pacearchaeota archaeon]
MILTQKEILKEIKKGRIKLEPYSKLAVGPASIDLTLDNKIRVFNPNSQHVVNENVDYKKITKLVDIVQGYILKPGELVLGITKEKITLSENICGWLNSRSRFARIGLMSHITAPFIAPGVSNKQVLEIFNASKNKIKLIPGVKICQLVLQECKGKARYSGIFRNQEL